MNITIRNLDKHVIAFIDDAARRRKQSRNTFIKNLLEDYVRDKHEHLAYSRYENFLLKELIPVLVRNINLLEEFEIEE